jgi:hypothetical protein
MPCSIGANGLQGKNIFLRRMVSMPESMQIVISVVIILIVYILTLLGTGWWTKRICLRIIKELEAKGAINATTAVSLPYDKSSFFKVGYRDYRPKALESLVMGEVVCRTLTGQYYLNKEKLAEGKNMISQ